MCYETEMYIWKLLGMDEECLDLWNIGHYCSLLKLHQLRLIQLWEIGTTPN